MEQTPSILLTQPSSAIAAQLGSVRPAWRIAPLNEAVLQTGLATRTWAFIDWLCPTISGLELCRRLRDNDATRLAHITMVLEDGSGETRRRALEAGADDYVIGPLTERELIDRVEAIAKTDAPASRPRLTHGEIALDRSAHQVRFRGGVVPVRPNEFRLLAHFMEHPDQVFSRAALIDSLGKHGAGIDERTVDVWIGRLRRALIAHGAPDPLRTVRSFGYVLDSRPA